MMIKSGESGFWGRSIGSKWVSLNWIKGKTEVAFLCVLKSLNGILGLKLYFCQTFQRTWST